MTRTLEPGFKFIFTSLDKTRIVVQVDGSLAIPELLETFEQFMRGCGFHFDGHLDIVEEDT